MPWLYITNGRLQIQSINSDKQLKVKLGNYWSDETLEEDIYGLKSAIGLLFSLNKDSFKSQLNIVIDSFKWIVKNYYHQLRLVGLKRLPFQVLEGKEGPLCWAYLDNQLNEETVTIFEGALKGLSTADWGIEIVSSWLNSIIDYYEDYSLQGCMTLDDGYNSVEIHISNSTFEVSEKYPSSYDLVAPATL